MVRLFIAVHVPAERARRLTLLRTDELEARWTPPEQFHVTLRFLGDTEEAAIPLLRDELSSISVPRFTLQGSGLDVFPSRRRPRVLMSRVRGGADLDLLHRSVERTSIRHGFQPEDRPFNPHVTVARLKRARPRQVRAFLKRHADAAIEPFQVESFALYRSDMGSDGAEHSVVHRFLLED